jgi:hypothetical protein
MPGCFNSGFALFVNCGFNAKDGLSIFALIVHDIPYHFG